MEKDDQRLGSGMRMLATIAIVLAVILQLFLIHMVIRLHIELLNQREALVTKDDLINLVVSIGPTAPPMTALEGVCTDCHTKEKFAVVHGLDEDVQDLVERMNELSTAHFDPGEIPRIEAALTFMKCAHCHSHERLKELAILSPRERWDVIVQMLKEPGSTITQREAQRIRDFYGDFWGWHSP
jgi:hypothetical protein